jgi:hypothetical protein
MNILDLAKECGLSDYRGLIENQDEIIAFAAALTKQLDKEWKGLSDNDIDTLSREMVKGFKSVNWLCKALESKLKEANK